MLTQIYGFQFCLPYYHHWYVIAWNKYREISFEIGARSTFFICDTGNKDVSLDLASIGRNISLHQALFG